MPELNPKLLSLFQELSSQSLIDNYYLAGGTNIALRYNHRTSIDLDLFVEADFDIEKNNYLSFQLKNYFENRMTSSVSEIGVFAKIDNIKVDLINYPYKLIQPIEVIEGLKYASLLDISAMKINAIIGRGSRKDFFDLHFLLKHFSLREMVNAYKKKYAIDYDLQAKISLAYFEDADKNDHRDNKYLLLDHNINWEDAKNEIIQAVKETF